MYMRAQECTELVHSVSLAAYGLRKVYVQNVRVFRNPFLASKKKRAVRLLFVFSLGKLDGLSRQVDHH